MANVLQTGAAWLGSQLSTHAARTITIVQGQRLLDAVSSWCSRQEYTIEDSEGFTTSIVSFDWQFVASDLPSDFTFRDGAILQETLNGKVQKYEAMPLGTQGCCERLDDSGILLTVHTKQVL